MLNKTHILKTYEAVFLGAPFVEAQVAVCELLQQRPLNDTLGRLVLKEVNQSVLQTGVLLGRVLLLGELIQAGILLMEGLKEQWVI